MIRLLLLLSATICVSQSLGLFAHVDAEGHVTCERDEVINPDSAKSPAGGNLTLVFKTISKLLNRALPERDTSQLDSIR